MENDKSPGIDGIPVEFYKEFYTTIKNDLKYIFNKVLFNLQTTPKTWNQAINFDTKKKNRKLRRTKILKAYLLIMH